VSAAVLRGDETPVDAGTEQDDSGAEGSNDAESANSGDADGNASADAASDSTDDEAADEKGAEPDDADGSDAAASDVLPGEHFVTIDEITTEDGVYVVEFTTYEYQAELPGEHVHFFFDTVPPEEAGVPGSGPWILYGGPSPFTEYTTADRPEGASRMCALVANPDHSVVADSGTCVDLP
jgi:hypothetical protein